jgi:hypothetical protein
LGVIGTNEAIVRVSRPLVALVVGVFVALVGAFIAELLSNPLGHRVDTTALPAEARAILTEHPGVPITTEQWRRLDQVMARSGGWPSGGSVFSASIRGGWYWMIATLVLALAVLRLSWRGLPPLVLVAASSPSALVILWAFTTKSALLQ